MVLVPIVAAVVILLWVAMLYNSLVRSRNTCRESWSGIDTELKRRYDLIPNLVETVKGYAKHEQEILQALVDARSRALSSNGSPANQARDENALVKDLNRMLAVVEDYPDLKADRSFLHLQEELVDTEDRIQAARRFFNANVRDLNNKVESVPTNLLAGMFGFQKEEFFEIDDARVRQAPRVDT